MSVQRVLPVIAQMKSKIDVVFVNYMGPAAEEVCKDQWASLLSKQKKVRASSLFEYRDMLASQLSSQSQKNNFYNDVNIILKFS